MPAGAAIPAGALWTLTVSAGPAISDMGLYSYLAGSNGESVQPPPVDARVTDDDAPGLLVLESGGGTNVTEPTRFVVLGEGFVTQFLSNSPTTSFLGDFGLALLIEAGIHNTIESAQDLELGEFNRNASPDIANLTGDARLEPHLTVRGSGDGASDFYSFEISQAMIDAAGSDGVQASFDIDHGYDIGDPKFWLSLLTIYNAAGDLLARGPGFSNPALAGAGGSSTYFDDFVTHTFTQAGRYVVEVGSWLFSSGLPVGVDYELQVSIEQHPTSGFLFAPEPVLEREPTAAGCGVVPVPLSCAQALTADDFFRFFDPNVGNQAYGGTIDFATPYARIQGSGDGSFDLFSFVVTADMLNPTAVSPTSPLPAGSTRDSSTYFTTVSLRLDGAVHDDDVWRLGVRYRDYSVEADGDDDLEDIANKLADELPDRFTTSVSNVGGVVTLTISDPQGFTLSGLQVDGVAQRAFAAGTVTRTAEPRLASGAATPVNFATTPVSFARADVTLSGTVTAGDVWSVRVNSTTQSTTALVGDTLDTIAGRLRGLHGAIASGTGATITLTDGAGFTVRASVSGDAPDATPVIDGTPVAGQAATVPFTQVRYTLPATLRAGEIYEVRVRNLDGTGELIRTAPAVTASDTPTTVAAALAGAANAGGYSATSSLGVLTINRATAFTSVIIVRAAGSMTLDPGTAVVSKTLTINQAFQAGDVWNVALTETGGAVIGTATAAGLGRDRRRRPDRRDQRDQRLHRGARGLAADNHADRRWRLRRDAHDHAIADAHAGVDLAGGHERRRRRGADRRRRRRRRVRGDRQRHRLRAPDLQHERRRRRRRPRRARQRLGRLHRDLRSAARDHHEGRARRPGRVAVDEAQCERHAGDHQRRRPGRGDDLDQGDADGRRRLGRDADADRRRLAAERRQRQLHDRNRPARVVGRRRRRRSASPTSPARRSSSCVRPTPTAPSG